MAPDRKTKAGTTQHPCGHCGEKASLGCKDVRYCSIECQLADWQFHKLLCRPYVQALEKGRPNADSRLAILIKEGESTPGFYWIPVDTAEKAASYDGVDDDSDILGALAEELSVPVGDESSNTVLPTEESWTGKVMKQKGTEMLVCGKQGSGELLNYSISVATCRPSNPKATSNKFLAPLFGERTASRYRGNTCLFAMTKVYDSSIIVDIDTRGFTLALNALDKRANFGKAPPLKTRGVRVNVSKPHYQEIAVPTRHPIFTKGGPSKVAALLGEHLVTMRDSTPKKTTPDLPFTFNAPLNPGGWLRLDCSLQSPDFGSIPAAVKNDMRSMLVVNAIPEENGDPGRLSNMALKGLIGVLRQDVHRFLTDTSWPPAIRCATVLNFDRVMRREVTENLKRTFKKGADKARREAGYESGDSDLADEDLREGRVPGHVSSGAEGSGAKGSSAKANGAKASSWNADDADTGGQTSEGDASEAGDEYETNDDGEDGRIMRLAYYFNKAVFLY